MSDVSLLPEVAHRPEDAPRQWCAVLTFAFPAGTTRHPGVLSVVEQAIDRFCLVDTQHEGVRVSYGLDGESLEEVTRDSSEIAEMLCQRLGLAQQAIVAHTIRPEVDLHTSEPPERHLVLLPDLH